MSSTSSLLSLILAIEKVYSNEEWGLFLADATKCVVRLMRDPVHFDKIVFDGPLAGKCDVEEFANRWNFFVRKSLSMRIDIEGRCFFCGCVMTNRQITNDHLWPRSRGGVNTVKSCRHCNVRKDALTPEHFRLILFGSGEAPFFAERMMAEHWDEVVRDRK